MSVFGYKAMNPNMTCRGFEFEVGKTYRVEGPPRLCGHGFHFCERAFDVWGYYSRREAIVFEIEALGEVVSDGIKSCTDAIRIVRRMDPVTEGHLRYGYGYGNGNSGGFGDGCGYGYGSDSHGNGYGDCDGGDGYENGYGGGYGNGGDGYNINRVFIWEE